MAAAFLRDIYYQFQNIPMPQNDFTGKVAIITGSSNGIGMETACAMAGLNAAKVILAVRNTDKGTLVKENIEKSTSRSGVVEVWHLDLLSFQSVQEFADQTKQLHRLDIVVQNAAVNAQSFREAEGHESSITVNILSTFLLSLSLISKLRQTAYEFHVTPHLVFVSSAMHAFTSFPESSKDDIYAALRHRETSNMAERYSVTKLMGIFLMRELAARVSKDESENNVVINAADPGICKTDLTREFTGLNSYVAWGLSRLLGRTAEVGSRNIVFAADAGVETHGKYLGSCRIISPSVLVGSDRGRQVQKELWEQTMQLLEKVQPGIESNLS